MSSFLEGSSVHTNALKCNLQQNKNKTNNLLFAHLQHNLMLLKQPKDRLPSFELGDGLGFSIRENIV